MDEGLFCGGRDVRHLRRRGSGRGRGLMFFIGLGLLAGFVLGGLAERFGWDLTT